jgi:hypothetical protein
MIRKDKITKILEAGVQTGADFAELFLENTISNAMRGMSGELIRFQLMKHLEQGLD